MDVFGDTAVTMEAARELVANPVLWPRVRDFLWSFADQVHPSWLEGLGEGDGTPAATSLPDLLPNPRVKAYVLKRLDVAPCFHAFPAEDGSRLLLLEGATLEAVIRWLGALATAETLRKVTDGATVRALKAALPGVYPEVFGFAAYFGKWRMENGEWKIGADNVEQVCRLGRRILFAVLSSLPAPLLRRLELKLPKDAMTPDAGLASAVSVSNFNYPFVLKLLKLRFPEAYQTCCS